MAFVANDNQQLTLTDSMFNLTEREKRVLDKSWAKTFAENVFPAIDESIFAVLYSDKASRPNTPVNVIVGALILKEALGDTDDELLAALMFDIRYQYALHTTSFEEQPLSDRTLSRFRARVLAYETRYFGINTIWYWHFRLACDKLLLSIWTASCPLSLACDTILIVSQGAFFVYLHRFHLHYSPQHSWGIRLFI